ncbi:MAG: hypothetical protein ACE5LH_08280 [Fidelibacterota bacterium]
MIDVLIRHGLLYDGRGGPPFTGDLVMEGDTITEVGSSRFGKARLEIDAEGLAVCPGFINMLSWGAESLLYDGRSMSDIHQGVTLEVFGEGRSMGPLNNRMKRELKDRQGEVTWGNTFGTWKTRGSVPMWPRSWAPPRSGFMK